MQSTDARDGRRQCPRHNKTNYRLMTWKTISYILAKGSATNSQVFYGSSYGSVCTVNTAKGVL
jgi:hypothetical protein